MPEILETRDLKKSFGEIHAVDRVSLKIQERLLTSLIGPNGAGKTTLIGLLTGRLKPDFGRIFFRGEEITKLPVHKRVRRGLATSFQIVNIFPGLTVFQNLKIPVLVRLGKGASLLPQVERMDDVRQEVERLLKDVGLLDKGHLPARFLSHGHQRLLEIALALATEPTLLFLDEPTAGLNLSERLRLMEQIKQLASEKKTTFVIVEHDMDLVFSLSDRIVVMHRGQVFAEGSPEEIKENRGVREIYLGEEL